MSEKKSIVTPEEITEQLKEMGVVDGDKKENKSKEEKVSEKEEVSLLKEEEQVDESASEALKKGWKPDGPKSAEEFLRAEPLYKELKQRGKEIKDLRVTIEELRTHMTKQQEFGYKKAVEEIAEARTAAIKNGDVEGVEQLDQQMQEYKTSMVPPPAEDSPDVAKFLVKNSDWINDPSYEGQLMRDFAQKRDTELMQHKLPLEEHLQIVENDLKTKFPDRFKSEEVVEPRHVVESNAGVSAGKNKRKVTFSDLNPEQKACARHFDKRGVMKTSEYIKQLVNLGEIS